MRLYAEFHLAYASRYRSMTQSYRTCINTVA